MASVLVAAELAHLPALFQLDVERAKVALANHLEEIRMNPVEENGKRFCVADGAWDKAAPAEK